MSNPGKMIKHLGPREKGHEAEMTADLILHDLGLGWISQGLSQLRLRSAIYDLTNDFKRSFCVSARKKAFYFVLG